MGWWCRAAGGEHTVRGCIGLRCPKQALPPAVCAGGQRTWNMQNIPRKIRNWEAEDT